MNHHTSKASLFLMELIIAILIFSLASGFCVRFFAKAHILTEDTKNLNHAVSLTQSAAEIFYGMNGQLNEIQSTLDADKNGKCENGLLSVYYDHNFQVCTKDSATYEMTMSLSEEDNMQVMDIRMHKLAKDDRSIYSLRVKRYAGGDVK